MGQCDEGFRIVDIEILKEIVEDCACPSCKDGKLSVQEKSEERKGLSNRLHVFCHACDYENGTIHPNEWNLRGLERWCPV